MKYEVPEFLVVEFDEQSIVACSLQENWGTGGVGDVDTELEIE